MSETIMPPKRRTALWQQVTKGAKANAGNGELRLQHCTACGTVQYPPREVCGKCLGEMLEWRATDGAGTLLSHVDLNVSMEPWFQKRLPVPVVLVKLDAGPVVYAFGWPNPKTGGRVVVKAQIDEADEAVLQAQPQ